MQGQWKGHWKGQLVATWIRTAEAAEAACTAHSRPECPRLAAWIRQREVKERQREPGSERRCKGSGRSRKGSGKGSEGAAEGQGKASAKGSERPHSEEGVVDRRRLPVPGCGLPPPAAPHRKAVF